MEVSNQPTLLLVEDAPEIRLLLVSALAKVGYHLIQAQNGQEGFDLWQSQQPDLVLMDVMMPVMDGFEACGLIRAQEKGGTTPIIMLTGSNDLESINQAFEAGASDFMPKPVNMPLLHQRIRYALRDARREQELRKARSLQDSARALTGLVFWDYEPEHNRLHWLDDANRVLPWLKPLPDSMETMLAAVHSEDRQRLRAAFHLAAREGADFDLEIRALSQHNQSMIKMVGKRDADSHRIIGALQDITRLRSLEQQAEYLRHHDAITGLPNRTLFLTTLDEQLTQHPMPVSVMVVNVDRLHHISDALGNAVADQLMVMLANRLKAELRRRERGLLARVESNSFAVWLCHPKALEGAALEAELNEFLQPLLSLWVIEGHDLLVNLTVGVSLASESGSSAMQLLRFAQRAMRDNSSQGKQLSFHFYQQGAIDQLAQRMSLEADLRRAVQRQEFRLVYQPQLDLEQDRIVGVESLLRWQHPERGAISPAVFIPLLEELGLIQELGAWILAEACRQQKQWEQQGHSLRMGINLSPAQFSQADLVDQVSASAHSAGAKPNNIKLEITESLAMRNPESTISMLQDLRDNGFRIAIDDFGVGFSSLEYLLKFPLDTLKIDRAFVKDVTRARSDRAIIQSLTSLCQNLHISTIAEGIETQRQKDYIDALGATELQGYLLSRPLDSQDIPAFIQGYRADD